MAVQIQFAPDTVGCEVLPTGDVAIGGYDRPTGSGRPRSEIIMIVDARTWPAFKEKLMRMEGVGVVRPGNGQPGAVISPHDGQPFEGGDIGAGP